MKLRVYIYKKACYKFLDLPQTEYVELTGKINPQKRQKLWQTARLVFLTPEALKSDLNRSLPPVNV